MKIALCLYGHFRSFEECWPSLQEYLIKPNCITAIFTMSWMDSMGHFTHPESSVDPVSHPGYNIHSQPVNMHWLQKTTEHLNPVAVHFDNYNLHDRRFSQMVDDLSDFHHASQHHRPKGTLSQVWARSASLKLAADHEDRYGFCFDRIVCTRWDIAYTKPILLDELELDVVTMDGMYGADVISDAWASGPSNYMRLWGQQFESISTLVANRTMSLGPHEWLHAHFTQHQIAWNNQPDVGIWIKR